MSKFYFFFAALTNQKMMALAALAGAIYYFAMFNDGSQIEQQINRVKADIKKEEEQVAKSKQALQEIEQVRLQVGALGEQFKLVSQKMPSEVQMADVIRMVDGVAKSAGVSIKSKEPRAAISKDYFEEVPLKLVFEGTFSEITMYLFYMTSLERVMRVRDFKLEVLSSAPTNQRGRSAPTYTGNLRFDGELVSYKFLGESKTPPATPGRPGKNRQQRPRR